MRQRRSRRGVGRAIMTSSLAALLLALGGASGVAGTLSYQEGDGKGVVSQTDDSRLVAATPDTNFGAETTCVIDGAPTHQHCTLKFPNIFGGVIDQIPSGSLILSATLTLFVEDAGTACPIVHQLTEGWTEAEATWNSRATALPWASRGAEGAASRTAVEEGVLPCLTPLSSETLDVTRSVQRWSNGEANDRTLH